MPIVFQKVDRSSSQKDTDIGGKWRASCSSPDALPLRWRMKPILVHEERPGVWVDLQGSKGSGMLSLFRKRKHSSADNKERDGVRKEGRKMLGAI